VWDIQKGEEIRTLKGHTGSVWSVSISPDGRYAISGSEDNTIKVWDMEKGQLIASFSGEGAIYTCA